MFGWIEREEVVTLLVAAVVGWSVRALPSALAGLGVS